jgi:hypothetical protein
LAERVLPANALPAAVVIAVVAFVATPALSVALFRTLRVRNHQYIQILGGTPRI